MVGTLRYGDTKTLISYYKVTLLFGFLILNRAPHPTSHPWPYRALATVTHQGRHQCRAGDTGHLVHNSLFHVALNSLQHGALWGQQGVGQEGTQSTFSSHQECRQWSMEERCEEKGSKHVSCAPYPSSSITWFSALSRRWGTMISMQRMRLNFN